MFWKKILLTEPQIHKLEYLHFQYERHLILSPWGYYYKKSREERYIHRLIKSGRNLSWFYHPNRQCKKEVNEILNDSSH